MTNYIINYIPLEILQKINKRCQVLKRLSSVDTFTAKKVNAANRHDSSSENGYCSGMG